jgi:diacylglycerol kinase family enzyme
VLDLIEMGGMSRFDALLRIIPRLYSGAHVRHPKVRMSRGTRFSFTSEVETLVDLDGETVGRLPLQVSVLPKAFNVGAP